MHHTGGILSGGIALSDDGARLAYGTIAPISGTNDAQFSAQVVDTSTGALLNLVVSGILTHQSQGYFAIALSGDGRRVALFLGNSTAGEITVRDVLPAPSVPDVTIPGRAVRSVALSDDGVSVAYGASNDASEPSAFVASEDGTRLVSADRLGTPVGGVERMALSGDGAWIGLEVLVPGMLPEDRNGLPDVFLRSVRPRAVGSRA